MLFAPLSSQSPRTRHLARRVGASLLAASLALGGTSAWRGVAASASASASHNGAAVARIITARTSTAITRATPTMRAATADATTEAAAATPTTRARAPAPARTTTATRTPIRATATPAPTSTPTQTPTPTPTPPVATAYPTPVPGRVAPGPRYLVGAYYFSGWSHGQNDNLTPLLLGAPMRRYEPLIGWYDDSQAQVDKNIDQAAGAGVGFFAFDWYNLSHARYATDLTLNNALKYYLSSRHRSRLKFCLNFVDQNPFMPHAGDWYGLVHTWISYFKQPDYVRVNGKPLFIIFSPEHMRDIFGSSDNVHRALDYLRGAVRKAGLPGVTIAVGATVTAHGNPYNYGRIAHEGYDITTGYNYHATGGEQYNKPVPYSDLVQENVGMWTRVAANLPQPYIPVITMGWDQRFSYRELKTKIVYAGRTPAQFACYASAARRWIDTHPSRTVPERIVLVFAWNEIGEGSGLIPNHVDGYAYGNVIRQVFGAPGQAPGPYPC